LEKLFSTRSPGKTSRDHLIAEAVTARGYSQMEVASFLGLHYSTNSGILEANRSANLKTLAPSFKVSPYGDHFDSENEALRPNNTVPWQTNLETTEA
jgi:hypothetical protein